MDSATRNQIISIIDDMDDLTIATVETTAIRKPLRSATSMKA